MITYCVDNLPREIPIGRQTETGVTSVGFDCSHWLTQWPGLALHVWVTAPGAQTSYPASSHILGGVLVWDVSDADTAVAGNGTVEIVGLAEGKKKLSASVATKVTASATAQPGEAPEPQQPWVDKVLDAADRAEDAAERAENAAGGGSGSAILTIPAFDLATLGLETVQLSDASWQRTLDVGEETVAEIRDAAVSLAQFSMNVTDGVTDIVLNIIASRISQTFGEGIELPGFGVNLGTMAFGVLAVSDTQIVVNFQHMPNEVEVKEYIAEAGSSSGGTAFEVDETLTLANGILSVNTADNVEQDNTLPVTSAAVFAEVGNINALLETI